MLVLKKNLLGPPDTCPGISQVTHTELIHLPREEDTIWLALRLTPQPALPMFPTSLRDQSHEHSLLPQCPPASFVFVSLVS